MDALILEREPGDELWFAQSEGEVLAETDTHYKIKISFFDRSWYPKNGKFIKCQIIKEVF